MNIIKLKLKNHIEKIKQNEKYHEYQENKEYEFKIRFMQNIFIDNLINDIKNLKPNKNKIK